MRLTDRERRRRDGELGEPARLAIRQQIAVGEFFTAERLVPVTNVHMMGDMEVMGEQGSPSSIRCCDRARVLSCPLPVHADGHHLPDACG
jgi:hypothetical protein